MAMAAHLSEIELVTSYKRLVLLKCVTELKYDVILHPSSVRSQCLLFMQ